MAKQTFTTGQVLTAAQVTSLQQTAMLGGSASAKVASYVLVAADAGTAITMSNVGATTITVNTGLFAAGDTVTILNIGAGTCTVTAGTATVSKPTNATLALVTSAGGVLYFTATGAATFMPFDVGSASSGTTFNGNSNYKSVDQSISNAANTLLTFDTEYYDTNSYHSTVTNTDRITVPSTGYYLFNIKIDWASNATGIRDFYLRKNGSNIFFNYFYGSSANLTTINFSQVVNATASDYFQINVYQSSGGSLNVIGGAGQTVFGATYLGA